MALEIITEPPRRALVVTPHPDDAEGGCGATMAKWIKESAAEIVIALCTNGDKGTADRALAPAALAEIREQEQRNAAAYLGVKEVVFLRHPDGALEDTRQFRGEVVREIRRHRPEVLFCIDPYRIKSHTHRDHRMSGQVAIDAAYTYAWNGNQFPEQIAQEGLQPHRVSAAYLWGTEDADVFVEVGAYVEMKAEALSRHASQMRRRTPEERLQRIRESTARQGQAVGLAHAEGFRRLSFRPASLEWRLFNA